MREVREIDVGASNVRALTEQRFSSHTGGRWMLRRKITGRRHLVLLALVIIGGLGLRIARLGTPVWGDETASWTFARKDTLLETVRFSAVDPTPPLYYVLLHYVIPVFGTSPVGLRLLSVAFGALLLPLIYWTTCAISRDQVDGLWATLLASISSILILYSQEARAYAVLTFLALVSTWLFFRCLQGGKRAEYFGYVLSAVLVQYTHYYAAFLIVAHVICALLFRKFKLTLLPVIALSACMAGMAVKITMGLFTPAGAGAHFELQELYSLIATLHAGTLGLVGSDKMANSALLALPHQFLNRALPVVGIIPPSIIAVYAAKQYKQFPTSTRAFILVLCTCVIVPVFLNIAAGSPLSPKPQWLLRGIIYIWPLYYMLMVIASRGLRIRTYLLSCIVLVNCVSLLPYYTKYSRFPDVAAFEQLNAQTTSDDLIVIDPWYMRDFVDYYYNGPAKAVGFSQQQSWISIMPEREEYWSIVRLSTAPSPPKGNVYVFYRHDELQWASTFPENRIYVYDPAEKRWRVYKRS